MSLLKTSEKQGSVYGLRDPLTKEIRYVGATTKELKTRLKEHLYEAKFNKGINPEKDQWINSLLEKGLRPELNTLWAGSCLELIEAERFFINKYSKSGANLVNIRHHRTRTVNKKTHCHKGHPLNENTTKIYLTNTGYKLRNCIACYQDRLNAKRQLKAS